LAETGLMIAKGDFSAGRPLGLQQIHHPQAGHRPEQGGDMGIATRPSPARTDRHTPTA
jgi:hypothetical protein